MRSIMREERGVAILDLQGGITMGSGDIAVRQAISDAVHSGRHKILLNMAGVTALDSSGVSELVSSHAIVSNRGGRIKLLNLPPAITDLLIISQLFTVFDVYDSEAEAIDSFQ
jgi:anti-sigma B factor antagonist